MVLNKIFGKSKSSSDLDMLKQRFSQVDGNTQQGATPSQGADPNAPQQAPGTPNIVVEDQLSISEKAAEQELFNQAKQPTPVGAQPLGAVVQPAPVQPAPAQPQQVAQPVQQPQPQANPAAPAQSIPQNQGATPTQNDLPSWAVEETEGSNSVDGGQGQSSDNANPVTDKLEDIEDKYYDAKLNSLIIDQVKELIEIDNNLNTKIDDVGSEIKKETQEREKLAKKVEGHFDKLKELESNMEKFLGLYEMVTNQFNPFVDGSDPNAAKNNAAPQPSTATGDLPKPTPKVETPQPEPVAQAQSAPVQPQQQATLQQPSTAQPTQTKMISHEGTVMSPLWDYKPLHPNIHPSLHFELKNGEKLASIHDMLAVLEHMDDETFRHHVSLRHNDFSNWIYKILGLSDLGSQLDPIKTRPEMVTVIRSYIQEKMKG